MPKRVQKIFWDDEKLRAAVVSSTSFNMAVKKMTSNPTGHYASVRRRIAELGLDTSHFTSVPRRGPRWNDDQLRDAVAASRSIRQTIERLGLVGAGGNYIQVQRRITELELDTSHMTGQAWNRGLFRPFTERPLDELLVVGSSAKSHRLKN